MSDPLLRLGAAVLKPMNRPRSVVAHRPEGPPSNVDRLVVATAHLLEMFGAGSFKEFAEGKIRERVNEARGAEALRFIHEATKPPYR